MPLTPKHLITLVLSVLLATLSAPLSARAQSQQPSDSSPQSSTKAKPSKNYWRKFALGFTTSILAHEAGHFIAAYSVGATPRLGFDKWRPTVFSGIDANAEQRKQFIFSSAGLTVQALLDEALLDIPHANKGNAFERGILAGGIATAFFYATLGRNASNSDITFMSRTSSLNKTQASLIYVSIAALHTIRIARDDHYANFFIRPNAQSGLNVGITIKPLTQPSITVSTSAQQPLRPQPTPSPVKSITTD